MKAKRRARSKVRNFDEMYKEMVNKGLDVNKESLQTRVRNPRRIGDLEAAQDKLVSGFDNDSDDDDRELVDDEQLRDEEQEQRGRKGRDEHKKKVLGKR